jgi:signal transduction histidine kinase
MRLKYNLTTRFMFGIACILIVVMAISLLWNILQYRRQAEGEMKEKATVIAQQLIATRSFIASKQDVINCDAAGNFEFKHLNPAAVGKGIGDIFNQYSGYKFKQTRLQPRDPGNAPDNFEVEKLKFMAADQTLKEVWGYDKIAGTQVFRYMVPLYYDQSCMICHGGPTGERDIAGFVKEGYNPGDFAGAISIVFPMTVFEANIRDNIITQVMFIFIIVLASIGGIYLMMEHTVIIPIKELTGRAVELGKGQWSARLNPETTYDEMRQLSVEFNAMADKLQQLYTGLEEKVTERTRALYEANQMLIEQGRELRVMNARLSEADCLKSEFLAVMSHELRTPLTAIIAFAEILLSEGEALDSLQREYLEDILDSAHTLLSQINDILNMSKIEAGLVQLNCQQFDIRKIVESLNCVLSPLFAKKKLEVTVNINPVTPLITADYDKISHVIRNLLSNAIKFTPEGGSIAVDVKPWAETDFSGIAVKVSDTGIGIEPEDQEYIFDKFRQVDSALKRGYAGSGLGLAIAQNLVELHGGHIWVESEIGKGSAFVFVLPQKRQEV